MGKSVLLVDDEEIVLDIARKKLENQSYDVVTASNGEDALKVLEEVKPDLIVLDIEMPKMNGYTFLTEWKKRNDGENIVPIIVLTAYDAMEPIFKRHGVKAYLLKPLKFEKLLDKIQEIIGV